MRRCKRCLLPASVPGADLDASGVCASCRRPDPEASVRAESARVRYETDLEQTLATMRGTGARYDALVCLSGGKDSLYLLHRLVVDYRLHVLAFTTDVDIPPVAWSNTRRPSARLAVDHLVSRPPDAFYRTLFRHLLRNQEARGAVYTVSYVYAPLFEGDALRTASDMGIPLVVAGYSPGQPDPTRMEYEFPRAFIEKVDWTPPALRGAEEFGESDLARFWNAASRRSATPLPRYIAPFHAWRYDQHDIMRRVVAQGYAANARHASPIHSNYPINWLLMYSDLRHFGYNPYAPEFADLIRSGKASRRYWAVMAPLVDRMIRNRVGPGRAVTRSLRWLGLGANDLRITLPRGAYDPPAAGH
jgi:hypothetical protein